MYNTLAARKQKNREAQASYKNRQTALAKHLGNSNEHLGKEIWELQQIHAATREECLLLGTKILCLSAYSLRKVRSADKLLFKLF